MISRRVLPSKLTRTDLTKGEPSMVLRAAVKRSRPGNELFGPRKTLAKEVLRAPGQLFLARRSAAQLVRGIKPIPKAEILERIAVLQRKLVPRDQIPSEILAQAQEEIRRSGGAVRVYDLARLELNYLSFVHAFPSLKTLSAVKTESDPVALRLLAKLGSGFDTASPGEVERVLRVGCPPERISFGNTAQSRHNLTKVYNMGIRLFVADSEPEVRKLAEAALGSKVYFRLASGTSKTDGSGLELDKKFGTTPEHAEHQMLLAKALGLQPVGISFHVGSQTMDPKAWVQPLERAAALFSKMEEVHGILLRHLDIGSGFPTSYTKDAPAAEEIASHIQSVLPKFPPGTNLIAEPGRPLHSTSTFTISEVQHINPDRVNLGGAIDVSINAGVFHGLGDARTMGTDYPLSVYRNGRLLPVDAGSEKEYRIWGPTCTNRDRLPLSTQLPPNLREGDLIVAHNTGAYEGERGLSFFNGVSPPLTMFAIERPKSLGERLARRFCSERP